MREIKFRGQDGISKQFVFGDLIHGVAYKAGNTYILPPVGNLAYVPNCDPLDGVRVKPDTVGQYTGVTDKNGKEIYEGDVALYIKHSFDEESENMDEVFTDVIGAVVFEYGCFQHEKSRFGWEGERSILLDDCEIIGNIHENPELLQL